MQWDDSENAGFSDVQPWISVIPNYKEINTLDRESDNSIFNYYRKLIRLRKAVPVIADGIFEALLEDDDQILAYKRTDSTQELYVFCNYFPEETQVSLNIPADCRCILSNYNEDIRPENLTLRPYEAVMFLRDIQSSAAYCPSQRQPQNNTFHGCLFSLFTCTVQHNRHL